MSSREGTSKAKITYGAYLSFSRPKEYLNLLLYNVTLNYNKANNKYHTIQKGLEFLKAHQYIADMPG